MQNQEQRASNISKLFFSWVFPLVKKGQNQCIEEKDLFQLRNFEQLDYLNMKQNSNQEINKNIYEVIRNNYIFLYTKLIWLSLLITFSLFIGPLCINRITNYIINQNEDESTIGYIWIMILMIVFFIRQTIQIQLFSVCEEIAYKFLYILEIDIIQKTMKLTSAAQRIIDSSKIFSLLTKDTGAIFTFKIHYYLFYTTPCTIIICIVSIVYLLGWVGLLGPIILVISLGLQGYLTGLSSLHLNSGLSLSDERQKYLKEFLQGIRILKFYAWEDIIEKKVNDVRKQEAHMIFQMLKVRGILDSIFEITPLFMTIIVFGTYIYLGNELDVTTAFTAFSLILLLQQPARQLAYIFILYSNAKISINRIQFYLQAEESLDSFYDKTLKTQKGQIILENCNFAWFSEYSKEYLQKSDQIGQFNDKKQPKNPNDIQEKESQQLKVDNCLRNLNLNIDPGQFIGIVGEVGSGKSTFINCLLNNLHLESGRINIEGKIAYVSQQAWLRNNTIRENILFGIPYNQLKYQNILDICELYSDISVFPNGDLSEIGERGVNLSGGQKQRISIARALYSNADIYVFDDCISALDMYVGPRIFKRAFQDYLKGKTRLLATHALYLLDQFDEIIIMKDLKIIEKGSYQKLLRNQNNSLQHLIFGYQQLNETIFNEKQKNDFAPKSFMIEQFQENKKILQEQSYKSLLKEEITKESAPLSVYKNYLFGNSLKISIFIVTFFVLSQIFRQMSEWCVVLLSTNYLNEEPIVYIVLCFGFSVLTGIAVYFRGYAFALLVQQSSVRIFRNMLHSLLRTPLWWYDITPLGRILNRCNKDQSEIDYQLPLFMILSYSYLSQVFFTLIGVSIINPLFWFIFITSLFLVYYIIIYFLNINSQVLRIQVLNRSIFYSQSTELISGLQTIKSYGKQQMILEQLTNQANIYHRGLYNQYVINSWMNTKINLVCLICVVSTAFLSVYTKSDSNTNLDSAIKSLCMVWVYQAVPVLQYQIRLLVDQDVIMSGVQRILDYTNNNPQEREFHNPKTPSDWPSKGHIEAQDLVYRYRSELPLVIKGVSFELKPSEKIGVCGRTGSGKSTLTLGLLRILELVKPEKSDNSDIIKKENKIEILTENQQKRFIKYDELILENYGLHEIRKKITIIPQDPVLFSGTLRFNTDPSNQYSDEELIIALQKAQIWDQINSQYTRDNPNSLKINDESSINIPLLNQVVQDENVKNKLEFIIEEDGCNLSVGQRQLICLARAILRKSKILLMDEATASIDEKTDHIIQNMIKTEFKESTVITVAHRLNTIINYDRILVLKYGEVAEIDTPLNLLNNQQSHFYKMIESQGTDYINRMKNLIQPQTQDQTNTETKQNQTLLSEIKGFFQKK